MFEVLNDYDWREAFEYAGAYFQRSALPGQEFVQKDITPEDVAIILWMEEGEHDEEDWILAGITKDDRGFVLKAGCDYTGWDCQAGGETVICNSLEELVLFGLDSASRRRLGIHILEDMAHVD